MAEPSNIVIERAKVREVAGIVRSGAAAEAAVDALLSAGFDRADIDLLPNDDEVRERLGGVYVAVEELPDIPELPRHAAVRRDDITGLIVLMVALFAAIGGVAGAIVAGARDAGWGASAALVCAGIVIAGGLAAAAAGRYLQRRAVFDPNADDIVLWVRVRSPQSEERARRILMANGAQAVRVHEIPLDKRLEDVPLSSLLAREPAL
jgi:hypothetical protein